MNTITKIEIPAEVLKRMQAEQQHLGDRMQSRGHQEGLLWAKSASYEELLKMSRGFNSKYALNPDMERFSCFALANDPEYGAYWRDLFEREPFLADAFNSGDDGGDDNWISSTYIDGWILAVEEFHDTLEHRIIEQESRETRHPTA